MNIQIINPYTQELAEITPDALIGFNGKLFPYFNGAYRITSQNNYSDNFGFQWNKFISTQMDGRQFDFSRKRFFACTQWDKEDLTNKNILEVGSGAGRFSQIVLGHTDGNLYSLDYSDAVTANFKNNGPHERLKLFQADIYKMPFAEAQFDKVFCFGVLQHTPDVERSVKALIDMLKPGGELVVDFYPIRGWWTKIHAKYIFRPFTKKFSNEKLFKKIEANIDRLISIYRFFAKMGVGKLFSRFVPICDINGTLPQNLTYAELREMCLLDTFDMFSPAYDQPQKISTVSEWFSKYGMKDVWGGFIKYENCESAIVKGIKKDNS